MDKELFLRKQQGFQAHIEHMPRVIEKIRYRRKPLSLENCYVSLAYDHISIAVFDYFFKGDKNSLKQNMHVGCLLKLAAVAINDRQRFTVGQEVLFALLSDNPVLIESVANIAPKHFIESRDNPLHSQFIVHMYQLAIQGDYEKLSAKVHLLAKNGRKSERRLPALGKDFFSLLMLGKKQELESLIGDHAEVKSQDVLTEDFMCFQGTIEAKICWLKGIEVQIGRPLLPMSLMPIEPLDHYDAYDFLEPGFVPPKIGWLESMRYRFREHVRTTELSKGVLESREKL